MKSPRTTFCTGLGAAGLALLGAVVLAGNASPSADEPARARQAGQAFGSLADLEASYARQAADLDRKKLADLAALAARSSGDDSERAFRAAFDLGVARGFYQEAEPIARAYLAQEQGEPETHALAESIALISRADRREFDQSLADLKGFLQSRAAAQVPDDRRLPAALICAMGEAYLQRLNRGGRIDIAKEVCKLASTTNHPDRVVERYFADRLARLEMVGKPAPMIDGSDVDGKPVRLADLKGKVVLVDFWASWCPSCAGSFGHLRELLLDHRDQGFAVIGVNLDALGQDALGNKADPKHALSIVRWFLLHHRASWPDVFGDSAEAIAKAYAVNEVPANFLVGKDGTIIQVELTGQALTDAIEKALK
jgi:thiol-disulfide isomerase/thioredoxin